MIDIKYFKDKLEEEVVKLEEELSGVARINPSNPSDWEATSVDLNILQSDQNESSDNIKDYEERGAVEVELENRLKNVKDAIRKILTGEFGKCHVCGKEIENERLMANAAASTCMTHLESK